MDDALAFLQFTFAPQVIDGLMVGMAIVLVALGLTLIFGLLEIINLAHGELYMTGAYAAVLLTSAGFGFWPSLLVAPFLVGLFGIVIERYGFRVLDGRPHRMVMTILLTFGIGLMMRDLARALFGPDPRRLEAPFSSIIDIGGVFLPSYRLLVLAIASSLVFAVWYVLQRTIVGAVVRATSHDRHMTAALGIPVRMVSTAVFVVGCALAGIAGVLLAPIYSVFPSMGRDFILISFAATIVGGMGSVAGAVVAGLLLAQINSLASIWIPPVWAETLVFGTMLLVLVVSPNGIFGAKAR